MRMYVLAAIGLTAAVVTALVAAPAMATGSHQSNNHMNYQSSHKVHDHTSWDKTGHHWKDGCERHTPKPTPTPKTTPKPTPTPQVLGTSTKELPKTGGGLMAAVGAVAMAGTGAAYLRSRRAR